MDLKKYIKVVKDFPKDGINFLDITPLLKDKDAYKYAIDLIINYAKDKKITKIVGPEARGFLIATPVAISLNVGFVPIRKPNKLPREVISEKYDLEYGKNELCIHKDAIDKNDRVLIVDDVLATGGTVNATIKLIERLGGVVVGSAYLMELDELKGREKLLNKNIYSILKY